MLRPTLLLGQRLLNRFRALDFFGFLALRLYLFPVFWSSGIQKFEHFSGTVSFFEQLGIPFPYINAVLATSTELVGAVCLLIGLATRVAAIPMMFVMVVAAITVHMENGYLMLVDKTSILASEQTFEAAERLSKAKELLKEYGKYSWLTEHGSITMLQNGVEWVVAYFIMLMVLFFCGAGRYLSLDYFVDRLLHKNSSAK